MNYCYDKEREGEREDRYQVGEEVRIDSVVPSENVKKYNYFFFNNVRVAVCSRKILISQKKKNQFSIETYEWLIIISLLS